MIPRFPASNEALGSSKDGTEAGSCSEVWSIPARWYHLAAKLQSNNRMIMVPGIRYQRGAGFSEGRDPLGYFPQKWSLRKAVPPWLRLPWGGEQAVADVTV